MFPVCPTLAGGFFTTVPPGKPPFSSKSIQILKMGFSISFLLDYAKSLVRFLSDKKEHFELFDLKSCFPYLMKCKSLVIELLFSCENIHGLTSTHNIWNPCGFES